MKETIDLVQTLIRLGLRVWEAIEAGDRTRTVGEIFDGIGLDKAEIDRLRDARFPK